MTEQQVGARVLVGTGLIIFAMVMEFLHQTFWRKNHSSEVSSFFTIFGGVGVGQLLVVGFTLVN